MRKRQAETRDRGASATELCSADLVLAEMRRLAGPDLMQWKLEAMKRFGIQPGPVIGLSTPQLRALARQITRSGGFNQPLAEALWKTGVHDARILASLVGDPQTITRTTMDRWAGDFASWDVCDACCCNLFDRSPHAWLQIGKWASQKDEFVRRAAFSTIAAIAVHDKKASDAVFLKVLPLIEEFAYDERNFVKKAVNWALRSIGKRNPALRVNAIACAERIRKQGTSSAQWIATDALRELKIRT